MSDSEVAQSLEQAVETWRNEIRANLSHIRKFQDMPVSEILRTLSAWSGRAYYIRSRVIRSQNTSVKNFRTQEVDYFIQAVDTQFKIWSRFQSGLKDEWEMSTR